MIAQELCLENEPGAGAAYMDAFDQLPTIVQHRLCESSINICVACLMNAARALARTYDPSPQYYCEVITHFEKGTIHDLRDRIQGPRYESPRPIFPDVYGNPDCPPPNFYDPSYGESRRDPYDLERSSFERMARWSMQREYYDGEGYDVRRDAEERIRQKIDTMFITTSLYLKDIK